MRTKSTSEQGDEKKKTSNPSLEPKQQKPLSSFEVSRSRQGESTSGLAHSSRGSPSEDFDRWNTDWLGTLAGIMSEQSPGKLHGSSGGFSGQSTKEREQSSAGLFGQSLRDPSRSASAFGQSTSLFQQPPRPMPETSESEKATERLKKPALGMFGQSTDNTRSSFVEPRGFSSGQLLNKPASGGLGLGQPLNKPASGSFGSGQSLDKTASGGFGSGQSLDKTASGGFGQSLIPTDSTKTSQPEPNSPSSGSFSKPQISHGSLFKSDQPPAK